MTNTNLSKKSGRVWILLCAVWFLDFIMAFLLILSVKSLWVDVNRFLADATSLSWNWVWIILIATMFLILNYGVQLVFRTRAFLSTGTASPGLVQKIIGLPVFLIWNGLIFVLFTEASDAILVAQITYHYKLLSVWIYALLCLALLAVFFNLRKKGKSRGPAAFAGLGAVIFLIAALLQIAHTLQDEAIDARPLSEGQVYDSQILFNGKEDPKYATFRIPGLVITGKGVIIAYCEAREGYSDWADIDVVMKRSFDGGNTWEPRVLLYNEGKGTVNNPVMIAENNSETVHFVYNTDYRRAFYRKSTDAGKTWSPTREITDVFEAFRPVYDWKVIAFGPGHGIQLRTNRLILPVWISPGGGGDGHHPQHVSTICSDDNGRTWLAGEMVSVVGTPSNGEPVGVELSDGSVMLNMRNEDFSQGQVFRAVTISRDGATGWTTPVLDRALPDAVCFGSIHRYDENTILFSNIHTDLKIDFKVTLFGMRGSREPLGIRVSHDDGKTWPKARIYQKDEAGYSDIFSHKGIIYSLYEQGWSKENKYRTQCLRLARFNLNWVEGTQGKP